jgi:hypothetical protein
MTLRGRADKPGDLGRMTLADTRRRRAASRRIEPLACCACVDPWMCRCHDGPASDQQLDGYAEAAEHLLTHNLLPAPNVAAVRRMWRRGGQAQRLAVRIAESWESVA